MAITVVGLMDTPEEAQLVVEEFVDNGFDRNSLGVTADGIGALTKIGVPEEDAYYFAEGIRRGGAMVTVSVADEDTADRAADLLRAHGAVDIDERAQEWRASGWEESPSAGKQEATDIQEEEAVVPIEKEELEVGKRQVERGGIRIYSYVTETPVEETVQLREEHATIERRPVDQPLSSANEQAFNEQTIEVRETAEEPVVTKQARVEDEVEIGKESTEREETIRDTLRETNVDVERVEGGSMGTYQGPERRKMAGDYAGAERRMVH